MSDSSAALNVNLEVSRLNATSEIFKIQIVLLVDLAVQHEVGKGVGVITALLPTAHITHAILMPEVNWQDSLFMFMDLSS